MKEAQSHKSFRPVTTSTFKLNWLLSEKVMGLDSVANAGDFTYGFHVVNVVLHGIVTGLVTEAAGFVFFDSDFDRGGATMWLPQLITGLVFGLHPVHAEAVSNITSRGELLMSLFFLVAFLSYATHLPSCYNRGVDESSDNNSNSDDNLSSNCENEEEKNGSGADDVKDTISMKDNKDDESKPPMKRNKVDSPKPTSRLSSVLTFLSLYVVPWLCMTLSLFCKEQGATTLISLVVYDFIRYHSSVQDYLEALIRKRDKSAVAFFRRTAVLATQTVIVCMWRYWLNGETSPDFIFDQNPAGFSSDRFTRVFSVSWVYYLYVFDAVFPAYLCPDWSGKSIDLITTWRDIRVVGVLALWLVASVCLLSLLLKANLSANVISERSRRILLLAFFGMTFSPFLLSSNLLVVVGLMKADRVIYLPLVGFCIFEAWLFQRLCCGRSNEEARKKDQKTTTRQSLPTSSPSYWLGYIVVLTQVALYCAKVHERNLAWSDPLRLWMLAYQLNPVSYHTIYNCGYELSLKKRYVEAEQVLRPIADPHVNGPSNTFVYAMVLHNLDRCDDAHIYIDWAMEVLEEKKRAGGVRDTRHSIVRAESNLLVARAFCTSDISQAGKIIYDAVQKDPTNEYAVQQATAMLDRVKKQQEVMAMMQQHGLG